MKKRLIICLLAVVLILGLAVSAHATDRIDTSSDSSKLTVSTASANSGDEDIEVTVTLSDAPALGKLVLNADYDTENLTLTSFTSSLTGAMLGTYDENNVATRLTWLNSSGDENIDINGVVLTMKFSVKEAVATSDYKVSVSYTEGDDTGRGDIYWQDLDEDSDTCGDYFSVNPVVEEGKISVKHVCVYSDTETNIEATCLENAMTVKYCKGYSDDSDLNACDAETPYTVVSVEENTALGHDMVSDEENSYEATCTKDGVSATKCSRCSVIETEIIPKLGHDIDTTSGNITKNATCITAGVMECACKRDGCDETVEIAIPATGHVNVVYNEKVAPSSENSYNGHYEYWYCADCDSDSGGTYYKIDPRNVKDDDGYCIAVDSEYIYGYGQTGYAATQYSKMAGDVDNSVEVDTDDAYILSRYTAQVKNYLKLYSDINLVNADIDNDGDVDSDDAYILSRYTAQVKNYAKLYGDYFE